MAEIRWKDNLKSIGTDIPGVVPNNIYMAMSNIEFYTKTIKALLKVGWSYNGVDGVISDFHNRRAMNINMIEQYNNGEYIVKIWKDDSIHLYNRKEYLWNRYKIRKEKI